MDKEQALNLLILLSDLETWSFSLNHSLPSHLIDQIGEASEKLRAIVLDNKAGEK